LLGSFFARISDGIKTQISAQKQNTKLGQANEEKKGLALENCLIWGEIKKEEI
jgi:hypothetical protein